MPEDADDSTPTHPLARLTPRTRATLLWSALGLLLIIAFAAAIGSLQRDVYSPSGFVSAYLGALSRHDARAALAMPGVDTGHAAMAAAGLPSEASSELLRSDVLADMHDSRVLHDDALPGGTHRVTVSATVDGQPLTASFRVAQTGSILGLLPTWRFATTPLAVATVTVEHADEFTVGGHTLQTRAAAPDQPDDAFTTHADYLVFAPGVYRLGHDSTYLTAKPASLLARSPGAAVTASVVAVPKPAFNAKVSSQLDGFLDKCAKQQVLQPSGCPFGVQIDDRVEGAPSWSMVKYPPVALVAGTTGWQMTRADGVAHLTATVQSLFDGTVSKRSTDEPFSVSLSSVVIRPDGALDIVVAN